MRISAWSSDVCSSDLTARKLGESRRFIVASPAYLAAHGTPQRPEDLHDHNCLNFNFRRAEPVWPFRDGDIEFALSVRGNRSEEHTSELQSLMRISYAVFCLKKKKT